MEDYEVRRIAREAVEEAMPEKPCPNCKADTTFIKVEVYQEGDSPFLTKWRCLNCLGLFTEELKEEE